MLTYIALAKHGYDRVGIIMADFPGYGLVEKVIAINFADRPPIADAKGPYVGFEGSPLTFDASGSADPNNDPLEYRWDFCGDDLWDTEWSADPTATYTWYDELPDDHLCVTKVEVSDGTGTTVDESELLIRNVAPMVTIERTISLIDGYVLPGHEVSFDATFQDPGYLDTHSAQWDFGDGTIIPGTLTEENAPPDATGTVFDTHTYDQPGTFTVILEVDDNDGDIGAAEIDFTVMTASEAVDFVDQTIQDLPESCLKKPANQRKNALSNKLRAVKNAIAAGELDAAINKLINDIRAKADGFVQAKGRGGGNDWITDPEAQETLCLLIDELVGYLESLLSDDTLSTGSPRLPRNRPIKR